MTTDVTAARLPSATGKRRFTIAASPSVGSTNPDINPYIDLFYGALGTYGIDCVDLTINDGWLRANAGRIDALHVHWPEPMWRLRGRRWWQRLLGVIGVLRYWRLAGRLGVKRIWTVHDLDRHEEVTWIDRFGYRVLARHSDLLICHNHDAAEALKRRDRPTCPVVVTPIGNYGRRYPDPRPREVVLRELDLSPDLPMLCCVGFLGPRKGLDIACNALQRVKPAVQLLIAGRATPEYTEELRRALSPLGPRGLLVSRFVSDQEFADFIGASEAMVLPYRKITGSSAALASLTLGRGIIGSDLPFFQETLQPEPDAGRLFHEGDPMAMATAVEDYLRLPVEHRRAAALRLAEYFSWERCVQPVVKAMQGWLANQRPV